MRSEWIPKGEIEHILAALMPENRLACEISLFTGLRINDVLSLKTAQVESNGLLFGSKRQVKQELSAYRKICLSAQWSAQVSFMFLSIGLMVGNTAHAKPFTRT